MRPLLFAVLLAVAALPAAAQLSTYGRLDVVGLPRPEVIDPKPVLAERSPFAPPAYVRVRPGEEKHWKRNCARYKACNVPVYFVREDWYRSVYEPRYRAAAAARDDRAEKRKADDEEDDADRPRIDDRLRKPGDDRPRPRERP